MALQCGGKIEFGRHRRAAIRSLVERATGSERRKQQMFRRRDPFDSDASDVRDAFTEAAVTAYRGSESAHAKFTEYHGYKEAVELTLADLDSRTWYAATG